jgi:hypothetical protein
VHGELVVVVEAEGHEAVDASDEVNAKQMLQFLGGELIFEVSRGSAAVEGSGGAELVTKRDKMKERRERGERKADEPSPRCTDPLLDLGQL